MPLKCTEKSYNKMYEENKEKIADKKKVNYQEDLKKKSTDSATRSHESYMKDQEKSCARTDGQTEFTNIMYMWAHPINFLVLKLKFNYS